jgi:hypothetical protein
MTGREALTCPNRLAVHRDNGPVAKSNDVGLATSQRLGQYRGTARIGNRLRQIATTLGVGYGTVRARLLTSHKLEPRKQKVAPENVRRTNRGRGQLPSSVTNHM